MAVDIHQGISQGVGSLLTSPNTSPAVPISLSND
jgi:hypothetical protein